MIAVACWQALAADERLREEPDSVGRRGDAACSARAAPGHACSDQNTKPAKVVETEQASGGSLAVAGRARCRGQQMGVPHLFGRVSTCFSPRRGGIDDCGSAEPQSFEGSQAGVAGATECPRSCIAISLARIKCGCVEFASLPLCLVAAREPACLLGGGDPCKMLAMRVLACYLGSQCLRAAAAEAAAETCLAAWHALWSAGQPTAGVPLDRLLGRAPTPHRTRAHLTFSRLPPSRAVPSSLLLPLHTSDTVT